MANDPKQTPEGRRINKTNKNISSNINKMMDNVHYNTYGTDRTDEVDELSLAFNNILSRNKDILNKHTHGDVTTFIGKLLNDYDTRMTHETDRSIEEIFSVKDGRLEAFIREQYRNRLIKQSDLHEITSQLIELRKAVNITRDAIISADIVSGYMSRTLEIVGVSDEERDTWFSILEEMEKKFKLQHRIKEFIIPRSLEYGEYYMYAIPYNKIFEDFQREKDKGFDGFREASDVDGYSLYEIMTEDKSNKLDDFTESVSEMVMESVSPYLTAEEKKSIDKKEIVSEAKTYLKNIYINNKDVPICFHEEGIDSYRVLYETFEKESNILEDDKSHDFNSIMKNVDTGVLSFDKDGKHKTTKKRRTRFVDDKECYTKLIDPMHLLPIEIMNEVIGYYYITEDEITPLTGILTSTAYYNNFDYNPNESEVLGSIADSVVKAFDKKFLEKNSKFKKLIVESLNYYKLHQKRIRFQYIPKEYIIPFKINEDETGKGVSILEGSLFYAKLYLMILLFKIMTIVLSGNDQKVNYVLTSGIDTDISNKIQEIIRRKQQRQLNVADMFSYTTLVNKIGQGTEQYIPVGMDNKRGIETEILQGQDVPLHTDLMEWLKNGYIAGTEVPIALIVQGSEAEFSKTVELANNSFQGSITTKQLSYNPQITYMYQKIARMTTSMPENVIQGIRFNFVQPTTANATITNDLISNHMSLQDFLVGLFFGAEADMEDSEPILTKFKLDLAKKRLPMLDFNELEELVKKARIEGIDEQQRRDASGGDSSSSGGDE